MKKPCEKCFNLRTTLGWSARPQLTEYGSGEILASAYLDRLLNPDFYPADKRPEDCLDAWPTCPECGELVPIDDPNELNDISGLPDITLLPAWILVGAVFLGALLLLFLF